MTKQTIIDAYIAALDGAFTYGGEVIPCRDYSLKPEDVADLYILVTTYNENLDIATKCGNTWASNILVDIVTRFPAGFGNRLIADQIRAQVIPIIKALTFEGLKGTTIIEDTDLPMLTPAESIFRNLIRFEHKFIIN